MSKEVGGECKLNVDRIDEPALLDFTGLWLELKRENDKKSISAMMSSSAFRNKPSGGYVFNKIGNECVRNGFKRYSYTSFCENLSKGKAYIPACLKDERKNENFRGQQIFCLDFDDLAELEVGKFRDVGTNVAIVERAIKLGCTVVCIYPTYSYSKENPKCRLVIDNEGIIEDVTERNKAMKMLLKAFKMFKPDEACKDPARLFFGTNNGVYPIWQA